MMYLEFEYLEDAIGYKDEWEANSQSMPFLFIGDPRYNRKDCLFSSNAGTGKKSWVVR
jgi:hypothetical protein